jgi:hypothetical protein
VGDPAVVKHPSWEHSTELARHPEMFTCRHRSPVSTMMSRSWWSRMAEMTRDTDPLRMTALDDSYRRLCCTGVGLTTGCKGGVVCNATEDWVRSEAQVFRCK